jgi:dihydroneopterin aldolase
MTSPSVIQPLHLPGDDAAIRRVFVRDLILPVLIGVHRHEKDGRQRVRLNLDMNVLEGELANQDRLSDVVCYEEIVSSVRNIVAAGHINLVETLAELTAAECLKDPRVRKVRVRVEKLDVFADAGSVGVEIERVNTR